jgi:hypothetical protein
MYLVLGMFLPFTFTVAVLLVLSLVLWKTWWLKLED